jgi:hypothetical protein
MPDELDIDVCPRCVWRSVPKATGVCAGCGYPAAEISLLRAQLEAAKDLIAALEIENQNLAGALYHNTGQPKYGQIVARFHDKTFTLAKAREKWRAVNGSHE